MVFDRTDATRASYDTVAADYSELLRDEVAARPWVRTRLAAYAEVVIRAGLVEVARLVRAAGHHEKSTQGFLLAQKP
jgi:hypothetical protein